MHRLKSKKGRGRSDKTKVGGGRNNIPKEAKEKGNLFFRKKQNKTGNIICQIELVWPHTQAAGSNKSWQDGISQLLSRSIVTELPVELYVQMLSD